MANLKPWLGAMRLLDALSGQKEIFRRSQQRVLLATRGDWGAQTYRGIFKNGIYSDLMGFYSDLMGY